MGSEMCIRDRIDIALFESFFVRDHDSSSMNAFCLHHNFGVDKSDIDSFRGWPLPVSSQKPRCRRICDTSLCVASDREKMRYDILLAGTDKKRH